MYRGFIDIKSAARLTTLSSPAVAKERRSRS